MFSWRALHFEHTIVIFVDIASPPKKRSRTLGESAFVTWHDAETHHLVRLHQFTIRVPFVSIPE